METITINDKCCIFLNHQKIIEELYQQTTTKDNETYSLQPELFNFKPKADDIRLESEGNLNRIKLTNRKRKAETENESTLKEKLLVQPFLEKIQEILVEPKQFIKNIPRFWEESQEFPQFRGGNQTNEFQTTEFSQNQFIIPPQTKFFNYNIEDLHKLLPELETYDLVIMDMPWQNKYIKRLKRVKSSLGYQMLDNDFLKKMPIGQLIHTDSLVVLWCTNALQHRKAIEEEFLPNWNLQVLHALKWFKINTLGKLISPVKPEGYKQPYEMVYIAYHKDRKNLDNLKELSAVDCLISIPSIIHSHKPPLIAWLRKYLTNTENFKGLEIFARYLQPHFTSIGLEVLKLMDKRLYQEAK